MKNVLLLTDFSKNAQNAIKYGLSLLKGERLNFTILYVRKVSGYLTGDLMASRATSSVYDSLIKDPKGALQRMIKKLNDDFKDQLYSFESICDHDSFINSVEQVVRSKHIDMIIMGTNGATGAKEVIFGSNTIGIIRNINCPVLVVPEGFSYHSIKKVLFVSESDELRPLH